MAEPLRHRQTKEAATDMFYLKPPRHISTLPKAALWRTTGSGANRTFGRTRSARASKNARWRHSSSRVASRPSVCDRARRPWSGRAGQALTGSRLSPSRELGPLPAWVYIKGGLIETVSRATSAIGPESTVPVPDGASADSARVLAARESEHQPPRPTRRKRLRRELGAVG